MPRTSLARLAAVASLALVAGAVPGALPAASGADVTPSPGAAGVGDSYFPQDGNGGYDVARYVINDRYRFATKTLTGSTRVEATATQALSRFNLDLVLTPTAVTVNGVAASFTHGSHELVVTPRTPIADGAAFTVTVHYRGRPAAIKYGGEKPFFDDGTEMLAINEPHIGPWWFAVNDHPSDRAAYDVTMTVPQGKQVISNGRQVEQRRLHDGLSTWHWAIPQHIAPYQAFVVAGPYRLERGTSHGIPYLNAVSRQLPRNVQDSALTALRKSSAIVAWEASQYGHYPYGVTGGVVTAIDTGFALECASRPVYSWWGSARQQVGVEVHELAHQWFGDDVSVAKWRNIWLNEGFATYVEWAYAEAHGGPSAESTLKNYYATWPRGDSFWDLTISNPGPHHLFAYPVYARGAMTLQALRHKIGKAKFATLLQQWVKTRAGKPSASYQFERLAEQVSGQDLDAFFRAWIKTTGRPAKTAANGLD